MASYKMNNLGSKPTPLFPPLGLLRNEQVRGPCPSLQNKSQRCSVLPQHRSMRAHGSSGGERRTTIRTRQQVPKDSDTQKLQKAEVDLIFLKKITEGNSLICYNLHELLQLSHSHGKGIYSTNVH